MDKRRVDGGRGVCYTSCEPRKIRCRSLEKLMPKFLEKIAEVLEVPSVTPDFAFRSAPGWSSLMGFALIVLLEQQYHVTLTVEDFMKIETVADLARAAGVDA